VNLFALWEEGYKEPWYIATSLKHPEAVERLYRWRMRIEIDQPQCPCTRPGSHLHATHVASVALLSLLMLARGCSERLGQWACLLRFAVRFAVGLDPEPPRVVAVRAPMALP
jgi:hypothetical protein